MHIHNQHRVRNTLIVLTAFVGGIVTTVLASIVYAAGSQSLADSLLSKIEDKVTNFSTIEKLAYFNAIHADMPAMIAALSAVDAKIVEKINSIKNINDASSSTLGDLVDSTGINNDTTTGSGQISTPPADKIITIKVGNSGWACGNPESNNFTTYSPSNASGGTVKVNVTYCSSKGDYIWNNTCSNGRENMTRLTALTEGLILTCPPIARPLADKIVTIKVGDSGWACGNPESNNFTTYSPSNASGGTVKVNVTYCSSKGDYIWNNTCSNGRENMTRLTNLTEGLILTCPPIARPLPDKIVKITIGNNNGWGCGNPNLALNSFTAYSPSYLKDGTVTVNVTDCLSKGDSVWTNCSTGKNKALLADITETTNLTCPPIAPPPVPIITVKRYCDNVACTTIPSTVTGYRTDWKATNASSLSYTCAGPVNKSLTLPNVDGSSGNESYQTLQTLGWIPGHYNCTWTAKSIRGGADVTLTESFDILAVPIDTTITLTPLNGQTFKIGDTMNLRYTVGNAYHSCGFYTRSKTYTGYGDSDGLYKEGETGLTGNPIRSYGLQVTPDQEATGIRCFSSKGVAVAVQDIPITIDYTPEIRAMFTSYPYTYNKYINPLTAKESITSEHITNWTNEIKAKGLGVARNNFPGVIKAWACGRDPEEFYLTYHPDVKSALVGSSVSGKTHYDSHGKSVTEKREACPAWN